MENYGADKILDITMEQAEAIESFFKADIF